MKTLTIYQPWASLIRDGHKAIETRSWLPPKALLGNRIAVHAGKWPMEINEWGDPLFSEVQRLYNSDGNPYLDWLEDDFPLGAVVCTARLEAVGTVMSVVEQGLYPGKIHCHIRGCVPDKRHGGLRFLDRTASVNPFGDYSVSRQLWFLDRVEPLDPPIPARGRQGLWEWEPSMPGICAYCRHHRKQAKPMAVESDQNGLPACQDCLDYGSKYPTDFAEEAAEIEGRTQ